MGNNTPRRIPRRERHGWGTKNIPLQDGRYELMMDNDDWEEEGWREKKTKGI